MPGFFLFMMTVVLGLLVLMEGLRWIGDRRAEPLPRADMDRLDRLESAVSALESRLDELQDQQRFLERLLAERPEPGALGPGQDGGTAASEDADSILFDTDEGDVKGDR